jgi:nitrite reductase (NADH) large subunit
VVEVDRVKRVVRAEDGTEAAYDRLLMCTGSNPFILPVPGKDLKGVIAYRDIADTDYDDRDRAHAQERGGHRRRPAGPGSGQRPDAARHERHRGARHALADGAPAGRRGGQAAAEVARRARPQVPDGRADAGLVGNEEGRVKAIRFKDGTEVAADLVVMAVGIRPNVELAEKMRLHCNRGIVVNDTMQTVTDARIYSVGECAAHRGIAYGLVAPLFEQAKVAANHLAQFGIGRYTGSLTSTKLKVTGIDLFSAGEFMGGEGTEEIVMSDPFGGVYKKLVIKDDKLVGACLYGDTVDGSWYFKLLREGRSVARHPRQADVRRIEHRRHRPRGPQQGREHARRCRGVRLQRREQGHHLQGDQGQGPLHARRGEASTPRPAPAAARAPGWSSRS